MTVKEYREKIKGLYITEFSGESCGQCLSLMPVVNSVASQIEGLNVIHVEVSPVNEEIIKEYGIDRVPTIILTDNGEEFARAYGFQPEEILLIWVRSKLQSHVKN